MISNAPVAVHYSSRIPVLRYISYNVICTVQYVHTRNTCDTSTSVGYSSDLSKKLLKYNGKLIIEIGDGQTKKSINLLEKNGFYINKLCKDLSGKNRCIVSTKIN